MRICILVAFAVTMVLSKGGDGGGEGGNGKGESSPTAAPSAPPTVTGSSYTPSTIYGVNLGGWLVLEPWITPSLFEQFPFSAGVVDEYTFCQYLGKDACYSQLTKHWDSFFSFEDLQELKEGGINTLRIPVGYWMLGNIKNDEPWVTGQMYYLERLFGWAKQLCLVALIDLHCGPGSQNGFDNSGRMGTAQWHYGTSVNGEWRYLYIERTLEVLSDFADVFAVPGGQFEGVVIGIGILNEPRWDTDLDLIKNNFYMPAYPIIHKNDAQIDVHVSDAFRFSWSNWGGFMQYPTYEGVYLDTHIYHAFSTYLLGLSMNGHYAHACNSAKPQLVNAPLWTVVGEWSLATTDCAKYLNGFHNPSLSRWQGELYGSPYFGSCKGKNDTSTFSQEYMSQLNKFAQYQMSAYEGSRGWFFWTAKTEEAPQWDYLRGLREGYIPRIQDRTIKCW